MRIWVISYVDWYDSGLFNCKDFGSIEEAQKYILDLLNQKESDDAVYSKDDITVIFGEKWNFDAEKGIVSVKLEDKEPKRP